MAFSFSVSDILKALEQIPVWKTLRTLPERVTKLEERVAALEGEKVALTARALGEPCPACGARALRRTSSKISSGPFGALGARDEVWTCGDCGTVDERVNVK